MDWNATYTGLLEAWASVLAALAKTDPIAAWSAVLAAVSFIFNLVVVRRQGAMQAMALRAQLEADLMKWGFEGVEILSQCDALARTGAADDLTKPARESLCTRLSTLIDQGRLIFPNQLDAHLGGDRNAAFRGVRPPIQDALVLVHDELSQPALSGSDLLSFIRSCRRIFVSELQKSTAPRVKRVLMARLARISDVNSHADWTDLTDLVNAFERRHDRRFWQADHPMRDEPPKRSWLFGRRSD